MRTCESRAGSKQKSEKESQREMDQGEGDKALESLGDHVGCKTDHLD
jgi:hypothetical protein